MNSSSIELDNTGICLKCGFCSVRNGKKYIVILVAIKILIIWYIYYHSLSPNAPVLIAKKKSHLHNITLFHIPLTSQEDMTPFYIEMSTNIWCFLNGINLKTSKSSKSCQCLPHWHGMDCGIPEIVWKSSYLQEGRKQGVKIRRRTMPRRIISAILFVNEYDLLDIAVRDTFASIDIFIVAEENLTYPSPLFLKLKTGFLSEFQDKIMPISVKKINENVNNFMHWNLLMLQNLWVEVWVHITDFRPDDIFLFSHVSSILSKDVLLFLKLYDGYPEPFVFGLRPVAYNFQRYVTGNYSVTQNLLFSPLGCSFQYFHFICNNDFNKLFRDACFTNLKLKEKYQKDFWNLEKWVIGTQDYPSGWQCIWCNKINEIETSLKAHPWLMKAFNMSITFLNTNNKTWTLNRIIDEGRWFDGSSIDSKLMVKSDSLFVPEIVKREPLKYSFLVGNTLT